MNYYTKFLTRTAVLLALCVAVQQFKSLSQFITGPLVNLILIIAGLAVGLLSGVLIAIASPLLAYLISPAPIMKLLPQLIPVIMAGNIIIVVLTWIFREKRIWLGLGFGALLKAGFLFLSVSVVLIPVFGMALNEVQKATLTAMFSYNQLITAAIGGVLSYMIWNRLKKYPSFVLRKH